MRRPGPLQGIAIYKCKCKDHDIEACTTKPPLWFGRKKLNTALRLPYSLWPRSEAAPLSATVSYLCRLFLRVFSDLVP